MSVHLLEVVYGGGPKQAKQGLREIPEWISDMAGGTVFNRQMSAGQSAHPVHFISAAYPF